MNIDLSIIDQRVTGTMAVIRERAREELNIAADESLKSLAFVFLCVKTMLDLDDDEAFDCLTEGGNDFKVDAVHVSEAIDGEFVITLFQGKYNRSLEGSENFGGNAIDGLITAVRHLFNPSSNLGGLNERILAKAEEIRSIIVNDGVIPRVRVLACNNGLPWLKPAQDAIDRAGFGDQVIWEHVNHERLLFLLQRPKKIDATLRLSGKALFEDMDFIRVCVGRILVTEVAELMDKYGDRLLERNLRRHLGVSGNRVNQGIRDTLRSASPRHFYFFNNGLTMICDDFDYNALQDTDHLLRVDNLQIVNGAQTCMTIAQTLREMRNEKLPLLDKVTVMARLYELPKGGQELVTRITRATNSQTPVDFRDIRSNDEIQARLEENIRLLGFSYSRKRAETAAKSDDITSGAAAEAILAVWRSSPHQAKFYAREHFGRLYGKIFTPELNGAQTVAAILLYRIAENHRRRDNPAKPQFIRYAS
jgi:hypothetical protein